MTVVESEVRSLMQEQHGLISRSQARAEGLTDDQIRRRLRTGEWVCAARGVYRHAVCPETPLSRLLAGCLACDGVASHRSAAALHDIDGYQLDRIEILVPWKRSPTIRGREAASDDSDASDRACPFARASRAHG